VTQVTLTSYARSVVQSKNSISMRRAMTAVMKVFGWRPHDVGSARTEGRRTQTSKETADDVAGWLVRRRGDLDAVGLLPKSVGSVFGRRSRVRWSGSIDCRGYVDEVDLDVGELVASFDGRAVSYAFGELDTLVPAYAATIHKSQGSEYPAVVIPVMTQHSAMLQRNLLYPGVTRGKKLVVLVGQKKAVAIAVRNVSGRRRWSKLHEWLRGAPRQGYTVSKMIGP
jgi:UvrD-like helicase C-terminal domain